MREDTECGQAVLTVKTGRYNPHILLKKFEKTLDLYG
jgi:hypothetical protein